jgi:hypothetical protein
VCGKISRSILAHLLTQGGVGDKLPAAYTTCRARLPLMRASRCACRRPQRPLPCSFTWTPLAQRRAQTFSKFQTLLDNVEMSVREKERRKCRYNEGRRAGEREILHSSFRLPVCKIFAHPVLMRVCAGQHNARYRLKCGAARTFADATISTLSLQVNRSLSASGLKNLIAAGEAGAQGDGPGTPGAPSRGKRPLPGTDEDGHATIGKTLSSSSDAGGVSPFSGTVAKMSNDQWKIQVASRTLGEYGSSAGSLDVLTASGYRLPITSVDIHPSGQVRGDSLDAVLPPPTCPPCSVFFLAEPPPPTPPS